MGLPNFRGCQCVTGKWQARFMWIMEQCIPRSSPPENITYPGSQRKSQSIRRKNNFYKRARLRCIKDWISLIAMLQYITFVTMYIQVSCFNVQLLMFIEQLHLLLLFTSKSRPLAPPTSCARGMLAHTLK